MHDTETEVKLHVADLAPVQKALETAGAYLKTPRLYERNVRYENADQSLTGVGKVLRLREDSRVRLTWKEPKGAANADSGITSRTELEVTVSDYDIMDAILRKLGYTPSWMYEKYRTTYEYQGCEIVLDEMPYGLFVEIEGEEAAIHQVQAAIGLGSVKNQPRSYSDLFFGLKKQLGLTFNDLTFENFKGVALPEGWLA